MDGDINIDSPCPWRINYERHYKLPISWQKNKSCHYRLSEDPPVTCLHCDGIRLALGTADGNVTILNIDKLPYFEYEFQGLLNSSILSVRIIGKYCVLQQCMLLQIFEGEYFIDAKSFDLGISMIEVCPRSGIKPEEMYNWYKPGKFKEVFYELCNCNLYATYRDAQCIYVWSLNNGKRIDTIHVTNKLCKMRYMTIYEERIYIIYAASRSIRHVTVYDINTKSWLFEVTSPRCKTQMIMCSDSLLIGVAVAGPALTCVGVINVWEMADGKLISVRFSSEYLSNNNVTTAYDVIIYCSTTCVNVWEPRSDTLLRKLPTDGIPVFLKTLPFVYLAVFTEKTSNVWDWLNGTKRFRIFSKFNPETPEFIFVDETMIILLDEEGCVQMFGFC